MLLRTIAEKGRSLKINNGLYYFVCMTRRMKCIELTLLSCLIARAFHVIRVICYIACHYIGANRPMTRDIASGSGPMGTSQQISQQDID